MKSEPDVYGIDHLKDEQTTIWDGIRNYQARNFMRAMKVGDKAFFYHSNCKPPGITGLMEITKERIIDPTQFDASSKYYDAKSSPGKARWDCVELKYLGKFENYLSISELREKYNPEELPLIRKGNRLSIMPINQAIASDLINKLGKLRTS